MTNTCVLSTLKIFSASGVHFFKLPFQSWLIFIPKIKTNKKPEVFHRLSLSIEYSFEFHRNSWLSLEICETNTRVLWSWKYFPVYKYNGIPFDATIQAWHAQCIAYLPITQLPMRYIHNVYIICV